MTTRVSVVMASYNGALFVGEALGSVFDQSHLPAEIIVVDDASTDETATVAGRRASDSPVPLRLVRLQENSGGPSEPLNIGVDAAGCEIVVTLDQDDVMAPQRIEEQAALLSDSADCPLVFGLYSQSTGARPHASEPRFTSGDILTVRHRQLGPDRYLLDGSCAYDRLLNGPNFVHGASNIAFRKSAWIKLGGFDTRYMAIWDYDFALRCCTLGEIGFIPALTHYRRQHAGNLSSRRVPWLKEMAGLRAEHLASPLFDADLARLQQELGRTWNALGYYEAVEGNLLASWSAYLQSVRIGGGGLAAAWGMAKAVPHRLLAPLRAARSIQ